MRTFWLGMLVVSLVGLTVGCRTIARKRVQPVPKKAVVENKPKAVPKKPSPVVKTPKRTTDQGDMKEATQRLTKARRLFMRGDYGPAEALLKEAITIFPFVPEANLLLGKIFLIRGAANRDLAMMDNARLMFEMARAMEPENTEITTLLELFRARRTD